MAEDAERNAGIKIKPDLYFGPSPNIEKPKSMGFFRVTTEQEYNPVGYPLRYLNLPNEDQFPLNINAGLEKGIKYQDLQINMIFKFLFDDAKEMGWKQLSAEFICYSDVLKLIMSTPYEKEKDWCIVATNFYGSNYLCKNATERELNGVVNVNEQQQCAWEWKFKQHCVKEAPSVENDIGTQLNCVYTTKLNGIELLIATEIDCIMGDDEVTDIDIKPELPINCKFVGLKTCQYLCSSKKQCAFEHFVTLDWWCQSFLTGIDDIYVGMSNENGFVHEIEQLQLDTLPKLGTNQWQPNACVNFLITFLTTVKRIMGNINDPYATCVFSYDPRAAKITYELHYDPSFFSFIPGWYVEQFKRMNLKTEVKIEKCIKTEE